eukprot:6239289-Lingulodinium_polyedra.AAC.1
MVPNASVLCNASQYTALLRNVANVSQCVTVLRNAVRCFAMAMHSNASQCFSLLRTTLQCFVMMLDSGL